MNQSQLKKIVTEMANNTAMSFMVHVMRLFIGLGIVAYIGGSMAYLDVAMKIGGVIIALVGAG